MLARRPIEHFTPPPEPGTAPPSCLAHGDCVMLRAAASYFGGLQAGTEGRRDRGPSPLARCRHAEAGLCPPPAATS